jgi:biopolymer transport protein ExbD
MYRTRPDELPELKIIDLTPARVIAILFSVLLFFVTPVSVITYYKNNPVNLDFSASSSTKTNTTGQVAGVSTEASSAFFGIDFNKESGIIFTVGLILVGVSIILIIFLIVDNIRYKKAINRR